MKKLCILILSLIIFSANCIYAQNKMLEKGFSIKFSFGFPPNEYGYDGDIDLPDDLLLNKNFGLEIGNQWYFYTSDQFGIGLDVNWLDVMYGRSKMDDQNVPIYRYTLEASFLEFGPVATFAINDIFALEGYYNLRPTSMATLFWEDRESNIVVYDFGFLHSIGIGARIKFIYVGYEKNFGNIDGKVDGDGDLYDDAEAYLLDKQAMSASNSRLVIGFQF